MTEIIPITNGQLALDEVDPIDLLQRHGYLTETSFDLPADLPFEVYIAVGWKLAERRKRVMWWISEWLLHGERVYGETYTQAAEITGLSPDTLKNYVSTANRVPRERRRPELHFSHHQEVAALEPEDQTIWLDRAVVNGWNRAELRAQLHPKANGVVTPATPGLEEAARAVVANSSSSGQDVVVKRHAFNDLCAALEVEFEF